MDFTGKTAPATVSKVTVGRENSAGIEIYYEDHGAGQSCTGTRTRSCRWIRPPSGCPPGQGRAPHRRRRRPARHHLDPRRPDQHRAAGLPAPLTPGHTNLTPTTEGATISNHFSAGYFKSPGDGRRLDITGVFLFKSSKDPGEIVLIVNSNPTA